MVFGAFHPWPPAWVALHEQQVVGFLTSRVVSAGPTIAPPTAAIDDVWVAPPWRGQGAGRQLVEAWRGAARAGGAEAFEVSTLAADADAVGFWRAMGFGDYRLRLRC